MTKRSGNSDRLLRRCVRVLRRFRDMYVSFMNSCEGRVPDGAAMGCPVFADHSRSCILQSWRASSSDEKELIIAASEAHARNRNPHVAAVIASREPEPGPERS